MQIDAAATTIHTEPRAIGEDTEEPLKDPERFLRLREELTSPRPRTRMLAGVRLPAKTPAREWETKSELDFIAVLGIGYWNIC